MPNLPRPILRTAVFIAALAPAVALAHPGHDDHDFTWELSHLAAHPFATLLCVAVLGTVGALIWRSLRVKNAKSPAAQQRR